MILVKYLFIYWTVQLARVLVGCKPTKGPQCESLDKRNAIKCKFKVFKGFPLQTLQSYLKGEGIISEKTQLDLHRPRYNFRKTQLDLQQARYNFRKTQLDLQQARYNFRKTQLDLQQARYNFRKTQLDLQQARYNFRKTQLDLYNKLGIISEKPN